MPYIYKDYVSITDIKGNDKYRYLIEATLADGQDNKSALIIMKNPSKATKDVSDQTVNKVLEILHQFKYSKVYVTNLIPIYGTKPETISDIVDKNKKLYIENDKIISELSSQVNTIFVGWGDNNGISSEFYNRRINAVKDILKGKSALCYSINKSGNPTHPSFNQWKTDKSEDKYDVIHF